MTPTEISEVTSALLMLRQSNALHLAGDSEAAIALEREARVILVGLLQANNVDTDKL